MSVNDLNEVSDMRPRLRSSIISYPEEHVTTFDMGWLVPQHWLYNVPGDKMNLGHTPFIRFDPFLNPILTSVKGKIYDFQIPRRILYNEREFEKYYTGGVNGEYDDKVLPHFTFKNFYKFCYNVLGSEYGRRYGGLFGFNSMCDYLGMPVNQMYSPAVVDPSTGEVLEEGYFLDPASVLSEKPINIELFLAYALVYREYFLWNHDETSVWVTNKYLEDFTKIPFTLLDDLVDSTSLDYDAEFYEFMVTILTIQRKGWQHDYFTSALPNIQAGDPAAISLGNTGDLFDTSKSLDITQSYYGGMNLHHGVFENEDVDLREIRDVYMLQAKQEVSSKDLGTFVTGPIITSGSTVADPANAYRQIEINMRMNGGKRSISGSDLNAMAAAQSASGFTINDLRLLNAIQVFKERQNIGGARLKEFLYMNFGVTVPDDRLDRPDFVGFQEFPVQISEVLQTSQSTDDSVLGDQGGHGIASMAGQTVFNYFVLEPMISLSLICILPDTYYGQGLNPFFTKISKYDEWNPVFNHLSDQELNQSEIYFNPLLADQPEFGYTRRFAEYVCRYNRYSGLFRKTDSGMMSWHQGRYFGITPQLGQNFIDSKPTERVFAVVDNDEETASSFPYQQNTHCEAHITNFVRMSRNVPSGSDPSLHID